MGTIEGEGGRDKLGGLALYRKLTFIFISEQVFKIKLLGNLCKFNVEFIAHEN